MFIKFKISTEQIFLFLENFDFARSVDRSVDDTQLKEKIKEKFRNGK